ncbi:MAG TPA: hypothetical protein VIL46_07605 [Gemmataceae bacterium]
MSLRRMRLPAAALVVLGTAVSAPRVAGQAPPEKSEPGKLPPSLTSADPPPAAAGVRPAAAAEPAEADPGEQKPPIARFRDLERQPALTRQMLLAAQRGAEWLFRYNRPDGRFVPGYLPALNRPLTRDHFLTQASAAFALARAARFTGEERYAVRAGQAVLALLAQTKQDPGDAARRYPAEPSVVCNRLGAAGLLAMAVCELPQPSPQLLQQAEQLCRFVESRQKPDGSLHYVDNPGDDPARLDPEGIHTHPGLALYGLMLSHKAQPAAWKLAVVRKALPYYRARFREQPHPHFVPWQTAAFAEAYRQTKEPAFAEFVFEMNDWLCRLQYEELDPRHPLRRGGFRGFAGGRPVDAEPTAEAALYAQSLADACGVTRLVPDAPRHQRYRTAAVRALQFLATLQYTEDNAQHFSPSFRPAVVGGFHPAHRDGTLHVEDTGRAVSALVCFLESGAAE